MIKLTNVSLMRGRKVLLEEASAQVFPGHKVALIGSNGCGKSSLFALLRHELTLDAGDCTIPADWKIVSVAQETPSTDRKAIDYVIDGDKHLRQLQHLLAQAERAEDGVAIVKGSYVISIMIKGIYVVLKGYLWPQCNPGVGRFDNFKG